MRPAYAGARAPSGRATLGMGGLGTRRQRYLFALLCLVSLTFPYSALIAAIASGVGGSTGPVAIGALALPKAVFPEVAMPKLQSAGAPQPGGGAGAGGAATRAGTSTRRAGTRSAGGRSGPPLITSSYSLLLQTAVGGVPSSAPGSAAVQALARALASAPVVVNVPVPSPSLPAGRPAVVLAPGAVASGPAPGPTDPAPSKAPAASNTSGSANSTTAPVVTTTTNESTTTTNESTTTKTESSSTTSQATTGGSTETPTQGSQPAYIAAPAQAPARSEQAAEQPSEAPGTSSSASLPEPSAASAEVVPTAEAPTAPSTGEAAAESAAETPAAPSPSESPRTRAADAEVNPEQGGTSAQSPSAQTQTSEAQARSPEPTESASSPATAESGTPGDAGPSSTQAATDEAAAPATSGAHPGTVAPISATTSTTASGTVKPISSALGSSAAGSPAGGSTSPAASAGAAPVSSQPGASGSEGATAGQAGGQSSPEGGLATSGSSEAQTSTAISTEGEGAAVGASKSLQSPAVPAAAGAPTGTAGSGGGSPGAGSPVAIASSEATPAAVGAAASEGRSSAAGEAEPAAGGARAPPATWEIQAANSVSVEVSGGELLVIADGVSSSRPLESVSGLAISGAGSLSVSSSLAMTWSYVGNGTLQISGAGILPITATGVTQATATGPADTLIGPAAASTWYVTGPDSGTVDGLAFTGFENLTGGSEAQQTFQFEPGGTISGVVDGGGDGFIEVVGQRGEVSSQAVDRHSGTLTVEGTPIVYTGMAPISFSSGSATISAGTAEVTVSSNGTTITVESPSMETQSISGITTLFSIEAGAVTLNGTYVFASGVIFKITAPKITIGSISATVINTGTGEVILTASSSNNGKDVAGVITGANPQALITITNTSITAGNVTITATASTAPETSLLPIANIDVNSVAEVELLGASSIVSSGEVKLTSNSVVKVKALTNELQGKPVETSLDAALAISEVSSRAITHVSGTSYIQVTGALTLLAVNITEVTTLANATARKDGAGIAVATVNTATKAYIDAVGAKPTKASTITIEADATDTAESTAKSSPGGATEDFGFLEKAVSPEELTKGNANVADQNSNTSSPIQIAAALAFTDLADETEAYVTGSNHLQAPSGAIVVHASSTNSAPTMADGSPTQATKGSGDVGVAVAIDLESVNTKAYVGGTTELEAPKSSLEAVMPSTGTTSDSYSATAISGRGDTEKFAVAGSVAITVLTINREATLLPSANVDTAYEGGSKEGELTLTTESAASSEANANSDLKVFNPQAPGAIRSDGLGLPLTRIYLPFKLREGTKDIHNGSKLRYSTNGGAPIGGLVEEGRYEVFALIDLPGEAGIASNWCRRPGSPKVSCRSSWNPPPRKVPNNDS